MSQYVTTELVRASEGLAATLEERENDNNARGDLYKEVETCNKLRHAIFLFTGLESHFKGS